MSEHHAKPGEGIVDMPQPLSSVNLHSNGETDFLTEGRVSKQCDEMTRNAFIELPV